jgi:hypothetical protein
LSDSSSLIGLSNNLQNEAMKKNSFLFLASLAGATLILAATVEPSKTKLNTQRAEPEVVAANAPEDAPAQAPAVPAPPAAPDGPKATKAAKPVKLSFGLDEVVKMVQSGVAPDVISAYIDNSTVPYYATADDVVRLHELGVPPSVTAALIRHGGKLRAQQKANQEALAQQQAPTPNYSAATTYSYPTPQPTSVNYNHTYPSYPVYPASSYVYPSYSYASYPSFYFSYSRPFSYRYYYPYNCYPRHSYYPRTHFYYPRTHFRSGVSVGFGSGRFHHGSPRIQARVRF